MSTYTCFIEVRESVHLHQCDADSPELALRQGVASLPYDDGVGPFGEELDWLHKTTSGEAVVTMLSLSHCRNTWLWLEGSRYEPQYLSYVIKTDVSD